MVVLVAGVATLLIALVLQDSFLLMLLPRRVQRRVGLTRLFFRTSWLAWSRAAFGCRVRGASACSASTGRSALEGWSGHRAGARCPARAYEPLLDGPVFASNAAAPGLDREGA
jgi:hypothetical protein